MTATAILTLDPAPTPVAGVFDHLEDDLYTRYRVGLKFTGWVMGGIPQNPELIEGWLRQRLTGGDEEVRLMMLRTLEEIGVDVSGGMTMDELKEAAKDLAAKQHGNTFKRDERGLYLGAYQLKAALRENVNILFAGEKWGPTRKGPKGYVNERVFIDEGRMYLTRDGQPITEPDGKHLQIGHVTGPSGPRSTLTYYDYVNQPETTFDVMSLQDCVSQKQWQSIFLSMQRNALGALRSQGYGQFKVIEWKRISGPKAKA